MRTLTAALGRLSESELEELIRTFTDTYVATEQTGENEVRVDILEGPIVDFCESCIAQLEAERERRKGLGQSQWPAVDLSAFSLPEMRRLLTCLYKWQRSVAPKGSSEQLGFVRALSRLVEEEAQRQGEDPRALAELAACHGVGRITADWA